jgi:tRNA uridine 5-carbamoylmethylation protein Kti12
MKGLPACGKSTKAEEIIRNAGNTVRINKDLLRTMLHFDKFTHVNEEHTRRCLNYVGSALSHSRCRQCYYLTIQT